jgi:DNA-binding MarR family transcriptional regulator
MARSTRQRRTPAGDAFTELLLEVFRLNGALIAAGNALAVDMGLTSSRWQVLGAIAAEGRPVTASQIARQMGLTRQTVQRLVDELEAAKLVRRAADPEHGRARLVEFTDEGSAVYSTMQQRQIPWSNAVAEGIAAEELRGALAVVRELVARLEADLKLNKQEESS